MDGEEEECARLVGGRLGGWTVPVKPATGHPPPPHPDYLIAPSRHAVVCPGTIVIPKA